MSLKPPPKTDFVKVILHLLTLLRSMCHPEEERKQGKETNKDDLNGAMSGLVSHEGANRKSVVKRRTMRRRTGVF